ncbi:MAG: SRPBCC family protein [Micromonosporaceae bacterium]
MRGEQHASRSYPAPAELVYQTATDPHQLSRWLPPDVRLSVLTKDQVQVTRHDTDITGHKISVDRDHLRVSWRPIGSVGYQGSLQVRPAERGSTAELSLRAADAEHAGEDITATMDETLDRLAQLIP